MVLREQPVPIPVVITAIDHRFTGVIFTLTTELDRIAATAEHTIPTDSPTGNLVRWLQSVGRSNRPLQALRRRLGIEGG